MKKKIVSIVVFALAAAFASFALFGCGGGSAASSGASADASASAASASASGGSIDKLVVGFDAEYPPYGYVGDDGEYTGVDLDLAAEVCKRNGWEFEAEPIDWDAKDSLIQAGTITCIWNGFTVTEERKAVYDFSDPYMYNAQVLVVRADSDISSLDDLAGKHVMTQTDSAGLDALTDESLADVVKTFAGGAPETLGDYNNIMMQLESGAVDAVVCDLSIAARQMAAKSGVFKQVETLSDEEYAVGFKKGDTDLANAVNATLKEMTDDGTVEKILKAYEDPAVSMENWLIS
ncbi:MAG: transporter substrate-binding domain-containing protein [Eggerthellaceae bacterium]|nr:transporter substrate-binding domain-containing protein [Eggerthellaceae bacterium]